MNVVKVVGLLMFALLGLTRLAVAEGVAVDALAEKTEAESPLAMFEPYVGKTWESGEEGGSFHDVSVWEWGVPGKVLVISHSVNKGVYSGVSLIHKDEETGHIVGRYATSAGFYTEGVYTVTETGFTAEEIVKGDAQGIGRVRSGMEFVDGKMVVWSQYETKDGWTEKETRSYREVVD